MHKDKVAHEAMQKDFDNKDCVVPTACLRMIPQNPNHFTFHMGRSIMLKYHEAAPACLYRQEHTHFFHTHTLTQANRDS